MHITSQWYAVNKGQNISVRVRRGETSSKSRVHPQGQRTNGKKERERVCVCVGGEERGCHAARTVPLWRLSGSKSHS